MQSTRSSRSLPLAAALALALAAGAPLAQAQSGTDTGSGTAGTTGTGASGTNDTGTATGSTSGSTTTGTSGTSGSSSTSGTWGRSAMSGSSGDAGYSMLPYTRQGYVGINVGQAKFDNACGAGLYGCDDSKVSGYFYTGGLFNDWLGVELGYMNTGKAERSGGRTRAEGVGASLVARLPMGQFNVFAKGGGMYAQTKVSAGPLSDVSTGKRRAWAPTWGGGVGFDLTPNHGLVLEWNRARLRFPGEGDRRDVDTTSVGYVYRF